MASNQSDGRPQPQAAGEMLDYEQLIDDYSHFAPPAEGELLQGHVLKVTDQEVIVDVGYKSEGLVPIHQFMEPDGSIQVQPGDVIDVVVDRHGAEVEGYILLSHEKARRIRAWQNLETAHREGLLVSGRVLGRVKGGLAVDVGVKAFMPASQADVRPTHNLDALIGQDIAVKIVKLNRRRGNVVVSRRLAIEEELAARKAALLELLHEGAIVRGVVKNLTEYGAFVDLGGLDGLLHVSDMSWGRVTHPSEVVHPGDEITVKILKFDREKERISLGLKQVLPDPWESVAERYPVNSRVVGRVVSITDYGAFVELEPGVEGLIHVSEMTWSRRMKHPSKVVKVGDSVEAVVLAVQPRERRISLGLKQLEPDPWTTLESRYSVGSVVEGRVRKLVDFGAFVEIEEGVDGLVHVSDLTWSKRVKHPSEVLKKGQVVQAVILHIDAANRRLSLGIKQLQPDAWETFFRSHQVGDIVRGRVCRAVAFGVFVEVAPGVEGLCHNSEIPGAPERNRNESPLPIGEEMEFKIIKLNEAEKRIGLSVKAVAEDEERSRLEEYQRQAAAATMTIEEVIHLKGQGDARS
ncbi:MAG: 30S ribosomal protein S1 [Bryobacterales bacterium]|nr:30S ribosomal protein S1 [Bryobacteraceae bacterium]MDW8354706.1 30S ribosomal protein S1 [Bryobacterales bacterium]